MEPLADEMFRDVPLYLDVLRRKTLGVAFRVHTALGPCLKEEYYRQALAHGLRNAGFEVAVDKRLDLQFEGRIFKGALKMDLVIDNRLLVEVKARDVPLAVWNAQVRSYLTHSGLRYGYLVNFHVPRLKMGIKPFANIRCQEDTTVL